MSESEEIVRELTRNERWALIYAANFAIQATDAISPDLLRSAKEKLVRSNSTASRGRSPEMDGDE